MKAQEDWMEYEQAKEDEQDTSSPPKTVSTRAEEKQQGKTRFVYSQMLRYQKK